MAKHMAKQKERPAFEQVIMTPAELAELQDYHDERGRSNPRGFTDAEIDAIACSLKESAIVSQCVLVIASFRDNGDKVKLAGHLRIAAAIKYDISLPVLVGKNLSAKDEADILKKSNPLPGMSGWFSEEIIREQWFDDDDMAVFGLDMDEDAFKLDTEESGDQSPDSGNLGDENEQMPDFQGEQEQQSGNACEQDPEVVFTIIASADMRFAMEPQLRGVVEGFEGARISQRIR